MKSHLGSPRIRRVGHETPVGKTRITIWIDNDVLAWFRRETGARRGYQSLLNRALRDYISREPLEAMLRRVVREELARAQGRSSPRAYGYEEPRAALVADAEDAGAKYGASLKKRRRRSRRKER